MAWPALLKLVDLWLLRAGDCEFHQLDDDLAHWERQHPTRKASR